MDNDAKRDSNLQASRGLLKNFTEKKRNRSPMDSKI